MKKENGHLWESLVYRPELPEGWAVETQQDDARKSIISFMRYGKIHHRAEPQKIYVVFVENNMKYRVKPVSQFVVRGGRNAKPDESIHRFNSLRDAERYILYLMECTDQWLADVSSSHAELAYEKKIADAIRRDVNRMTQ
jgi:hypothetical protein